MLHGRQFQPAASQPIRREVNAQVVHRLRAARGSGIILPVVGQVGTHQNDIARLEAGQVIADHAVAAGFAGQGDFEFRMKMPDAPKSFSLNDVAVDAVFNAGGQFFIRGFHGQELDKSG